MSGNNILPERYVLVTQYQGKNGGFAIRDTLLYRVELIAECEARRVPEIDTWGTSDAGRAHTVAQNWATFLGWPVFNAEEKVETKVTIEIKEQP